MNLFFASSYGEEKRYSYYHWIKSWSAWENERPYFTKQKSNIYLKEFSGQKIFFVENSTFHDLEFLLQKSNTLIACHGSLQQSASAFEVRTLDIFEKKHKIWYLRHTKHIKNYKFLYRKSFALLKEELLSFFR